MPPSRVSEWLKRQFPQLEVLDAWNEVKDKVREESPEAYAFLDPLARDDHVGAAKAVLAWGTVVDAVAKVFGSQEAAKAVLASPLVVNATAEVMERVDEVFPEETFIRIMERLRLPREKPATEEVGPGRTSPS